MHGELCEKRARQVTVALQALDYLAPSCLKQLIHWERRLQELKPEERYGIKLRTKSAIAWQRSALPALSHFDTKILTVES